MNSDRVEFQPIQTVSASTTQEARTPLPREGFGSYVTAVALAGTLILGSVAVTGFLSKSTFLSQPKPVSVPPPAVEADPIQLMAALDKGSVALAKKVLPSVVSIDTTSNQYSDSWVIGADMRARLYDREVESEYGIGSGVIISPEGHIVTNHHVVKMLNLKNGDDRLDVWINNSSTPEPVELLGVDEHCDIAVLKLKNTKGKSLPHLDWGNSDEMSMGSLVFAFGSPFGLSETMTTGRISNNHRELNGTGDAMKFFQTDCVINPGNSGGPLVNYRGEIIGINWAIYSNQENDKSWQGVGLVLPGNHVKRVVEAIIKKKSGAPYVGVDFGEKQRADGQDIVITMVDSASPAAKAGLKVGDVVRKVNGIAPADAVSAWTMVTQAGGVGKVGFVVGKSDEEGREISVTLPR